MAKVRANIYLDEEIKQWCDSQSDIMGMSLSAFITMCVYHHKQSQEGLKAMQNMSYLAEQLQEIKKLVDQKEVKEE